MKLYILKVGKFVKSTLKYGVASDEVAGFANYKFDWGPHWILIVKAFVSLQVAP